MTTYDNDTIRYSGVRAMKKRILLFTVSAILIFAMSSTTFASTNFDLRKKTVGLAGITDSSVNTNGFVTRAEFARMLVMASPYSDFLSSNCGNNVYADVPATNEYASAIKICAENNLMRGFLGGVFRPEQTITLNDAERAMLTLLGYTENDFAGDVVSKRAAKAESLSLTENVYRTLTDGLTYADCINMFYNLMRCNTTQGKSYASVLGGSLSSDGEVNALGMIDNALKGPKYFTNKESLISWLPFDHNKASVYIDGEASSWSTLSSGIGSGMVVYYSSKAKTIWAYEVDDGTKESGKGAMRGTIDNIIYQSADTLTPSGVEIDGVQFNLESSDMQFAFSIYGSCKVGEKVTVIYNATRGGSGNPSIIDYIYE